MKLDRLASATERLFSTVFIYLKQTGDIKLAAVVPFLPFLLCSFSSLSSHVLICNRLAYMTNAFCLFVCPCACLFCWFSADFLSFKGTCRCVPDFKSRACAQSIMMQVKHLISDGSICFVLHNRPHPAASGGRQMALRAWVIFKLRYYVINFNHLNQS